MRNRRIKKIIVAASGVVLIVTLLMSGRYFSRKGGIYLKNLTIQSEGTGVDKQWLQEALREDTEQQDDGAESSDTSPRKYSFAAWTQCRKESLRSESGGKNCTADVIAVYGPSCCVFPVGKNIPASDPEGCIIGKKLSEELFGSDHAEGEKLVWREDEWIVRGIVEEPAELCLLQASDQIDRLTFDKVSLAMAAEDERQQTGEEFILQQGLCAHVLRFDYLYGMEWLGEVVPARWSDFDSWQQNFGEHSRAVKLAKTAERTVIEETGLEYQKWGEILTVSGIVFVAAGLGVMWWCQRRQNSY